MQSAPKSHLLAQEFVKGSLNVNSGGRGRLSGITVAIGLLLFILVASPLIEQIPLAALIGVMFIVVIGTFEWSSFRVLRKVPRSDAREDHKGSTVFWFRDVVSGSLRSWSGQRRCVCVRRTCIRLTSETDSALVGLFERMPGHLAIALIGGNAGGVFTDGNTELVGPVQQRHHIFQVTHFKSESFHT